MTEPDGWPRKVPIMDWKDIAVLSVGLIGFAVTFTFFVFWVVAQF